jgi:tetratricopeptide (TPR) repeat protein
LGVLAWALILTGNMDEGIAILERTVELTPGNMVFVGQLAQAHARAGHIDRARAILAELHERAQRDYVADITFAYAYTGLGELDKAMDHLEKAFEQRSANIYGIKGSYLLAPLREHPRFQALLRKMNL